MAEGRRHQNMVNGGNNSLGVGSASSSSSSSSSNASNHLVVNQADSAVMIPLSAGDLDVLRANGIQFSTATTLSNSNNINIVGSGSNNLNLSLSGGNVILSNTLDGDGCSTAAQSVIMDTGNLNGHHQHQQQQQHHHQRQLHLQQQQHSLQNVARGNDGGVRADLHSNEISSNGIIDSQGMVNDSVNGSILNIANGHDSLGGGATHSSAASLIQALGAAVSRAVASGTLSGLLPSSVNLPMSLNQNNIISGGDMLTLGSNPTSIMNGPNAQLLINQQQQEQQQQQRQQQLVLSQVANLADGNSIMNTTPSVNLHHGAMRNNNSSMVRNVGNISAATTSSGQNTGAGMNVTLGSQQQQQQQQQMWVQPDQSGFMPAAVSLASQGSMALQGSQRPVSLQGPSSSQDRPSLHDLQVQLDENQYQDVRAQFPNVFQIQTPNNRPVTYQAAAHSTFGRASPASDYQDMEADSEATPSYPDTHHMSAENHVAVNAAAQLIAAPTVDSSTLQQGYQIVYDAETRVLALQRVMSPSDCTVSQSTLSMEGSEAQPNPPMLPTSCQPVQSYTMVQVTSMPTTFVNGSSSTGEVSTSSMAAMLNAQDRASSSGVSSLNRSLTTPRQNVVALPKLEQKGELEGVAECDTTQDIEFHQQRSPTYMDTSNNIDDEQSLDSTSLHSTIPEAGVASSGEVIMDSTLDSSDLTPLHPVSMDTSREVMQSQQSALTPGQGNNSGASHVTEINESMPGPSGLEPANLNRVSDVAAIPSSSKSVNRVIRKSRRLELVEQEPKASQRKKNYSLQQYNPSMLWCEDCMQTFEDQCPVHRLSAIPDKIVLSRAWASAPNQIQIFRVSVDNLEAGDSDVAVQAKRQIPKFTQFGPFTGDLVDSMDKVVRKVFPLMLECTDGSRKYFETSDENKCNWMMFVRPAKTFAEQNLVAYQHKQDIYFSVTKLIESKQELKVWYAAHYAERMGVKPLELTDEDLQALDEEDAKFECFECSRKFKTSVALQKHLTTHDSEDMRDFDEVGDDDADFITNEGKGLEMDKQKGTFLRGKLIQGKNRNRNAEAGTYQWKKKSTSIYINKTLKKYKKRQCSEKVLQSMKSMYRRQGKVSGGNEWMCTYCGLTFDNSSLLNLHTLTHAAEDLGMDEIKKLAEEQNGEMSQPDLVNGVKSESSAATLASMMNLDTPMVACPKCNIVFNDQKSLMDHVSTHGQKPMKRDKPYDCNKCNKSFSSEEKLIKHQMVHGDDANKPLECIVCFKRVMNNSAMACHMKTHSDRKYYDCPVCGQDFDMVANLKEHALIHMNKMGQYPCTSCQKTFEDFSILKKHIKTFHSDRVFECPECGKPFPRVDKLRLHMLRHTNHREFMCETCGRQFKRKDKLKEHMKRMHSKERMEQQLLAKQQQNNKFTPKVMPSEYHRFIYKCHTCLLGFKRRGMLVNHLAKRHPDIKPEQVPELNLPILKTQKDFYCQYCDKIYKSSSKRKAHIQKNHPGCPIPPSSRKKTVSPEGARGFSNNSYSHTVSSVTTMPHGCKFCHKQYASKAKLLQHQRKAHAELVEPALERRRLKRVQPSDFLQITVADGSQNLGERYEAVPIAVVTQADTLPSADLLTQAMSELHSYTSEFTISPRLAQGGAPTMVHIQSNGQLQPATIDINQLNQALHSFTSQAGGVATVLAQPPQPSSPTQSVTVVAPNGSQTINLGNAQFITRAWTSSFAPTFR